MKLSDMTKYMLEALQAEYPNLDADELIALGVSNLYKATFKGEE